ncbi:MAG: hypothetical protein QM715_12430 [Nibricoccus sp.]
MKKPVTRSPLDLLPLHQKQAVMAWLTTGGKHGQGMSYEDASAKLKAEFGVRASATALHAFYHRHRGAPTTPQVQTAFDAKSNVLTISIQINLNLNPQKT